MKGASHKRPLNKADWWLPGDSGGQNGHGLSFGCDMKMFRSWTHVADANIVNVLNATELYALKGLILCYMDFTSTTITTTK